MMRRPLLIANWKMQGTRASTQVLLTAIKEGTANQTHKFSATSTLLPEMLILPPAIFLDQTESLLKDSPIAWGGQNMASAREGAFTGELSAMMLKEFGCRYVLLGHSERRQYYGETDAELARKFSLASALGLIPVLCVGESLQQYQADQTQTVIQQQLAGVLKLGSTILQEAVIAYEPIWAIGTGLSADPAYVQTVHAMLRQLIAAHDPVLAQTWRILYGGSVKPDNAKGLFGLPDVDGGLVGAASLVAQTFLEIYQVLCTQRS